MKEFKPGTYLTRNNKTAIVTEIVSIPEDQSKCWDESNVGMYYLTGYIPGYGDCEWYSDGTDIGEDPNWDLVSPIISDS